MDEERRGGWVEDRLETCAPLWFGTRRPRAKVFKSRINVFVNV